MVKEFGTLKLEKQGPPGELPAYITLKKATIQGSHKSSLRSTDMPPSPTRNPSNEKRHIMRKLVEKGGNTKTSWSAPKTASQIPDRCTIRAERREKDRRQ